MKGKILLLLVVALIVAAVFLVLALFNENDLTFLIISGSICIVIFIIILIEHFVRKRKEKN